MKIIKRNGSEVTFEVEKIVNAIAKANAEVPEDQRLTEREIQFASLNVTDECEKAGHTVTVEEVAGSQPAGQVLSVEPGEGSKVDKNSTVKLKVSKGSQGNTPSPSPTKSH